jgi:sodium borate transporter 11
MLLGFPLSLLFFMDQNIAESMVNSPDNKLLKGILMPGGELLTD